MTTQKIADLIKQLWKHQKKSSDTLERLWPTALTEGKDPKAFDFTGNSPADLENFIVAMSKEGYRPGSLADLIRFLEAQHPEYLKEDCSCNNAYVALGTIAIIDGRSASPCFDTELVSLGSSIDRDLMHYYTPRIELVFLDFADPKEYYERTLKRHPSFLHDKKIIVGVR